MTELFRQQFSIWRPVESRGNEEGCKYSIDEE